MSRDLLIGTGEEAKHNRSRSVYLAFSLLFRAEGHCCKLNVEEHCTLGFQSMFKNEQGFNILLLLEAILCLVKAPAIRERASECVL
jgi:hypothetical protein